MTSEEREKKIDDVLGRVEDWNREFLIEQVKEYWFIELDRMSDPELNEEWNLCFEGRDWRESFE